MDEDGSIASACLRFCDIFAGWDCMDCDLLVGCGNLWDRRKGSFSGAAELRLLDRLMHAKQDHALGVHPHSLTLHDSAA